jgi:hypothetical protein
LNAIDQLLADIDALNRYATPAPWKVDEDGDLVEDVTGKMVCVIAEKVGVGDPDGALIVALRNAWSQLSEALRAPLIRVTYPELSPEERERLREKLAQLGASGVMPIGEPFEITDDRHDIAERLADAEQRADQVSEERAALAEQLDVAEREVKRLRRQLGGERKRRSAKKARKRWSR